jgi:CRISPR-associated protein Csb1
VSATIRAFNVYRHTRHAQYNPVINFKKDGLLDGIDASDDDLAQKGYVSQPIGKQPGKPDPTHGGVQLMKGDKLQGNIRRDATLGFAALRRLAVLEANGTVSIDRTDALRRYILGLALVALTATQESYLRQGCNLVPANEGKFRKFEIIHANGKRVRIFEQQKDVDEFKKQAPDAEEPFVLTPSLIKQFAFLAAKKFGIDPDRDRNKNEIPDREVSFKKELAAKDIKGDKEKLKGEAVSVDPAEKKFKLKSGKGRDQKEIEVATNDSTTFMKGKEESTFVQVVVVDAKLDVDVVNGVAVKVTAKK